MIIFNSYVKLPEGKWPKFLVNLIHDDPYIKMTGDLHQSLQNNKKTQRYSGSNGSNESIKSLMKPPSSFGAFRAKGSPLRVRKRRIMPSWNSFTDRPCMMSCTESSSKRLWCTSSFRNSTCAAKPIPIIPGSSPWVLVSFGDLPKWQKMCEITNYKSHVLSLVIWCYSISRIPVMVGSPGGGVAISQLCLVTSFTQFFFPTSSRSTSSFSAAHRKRATCCPLAAQDRLGKSRMKRISAGPPEGFTGKTQMGVDGLV